VALAYKSVWRVERSFGETKSTLEARPMDHQNNEAMVGHIVAWLLALGLVVDLQRRLDERGLQASWPDFMRNLKQLAAVDLHRNGQRYRLRTALQGQAYQAFVAAGVRPPATVTHLARGIPRRPSDLARDGGLWCERPNYVFQFTPCE
jgi:hypothetical protein